MLTCYMVQRKSVLRRILATAILVTLVAFSVAPTAWARNTYVIKDGDTTTEVVTYETDPAQVLSEAGVELSENDIYTTQPVDGVYAITVQRAQTVIVNYCGTEQTVTAHGQTVGELLKQLQIPAGGNYAVSADLTEVTFEGMEIRVDHVVTTCQTYTTEIPFETTYLYDPALPEGREVVTVTGVAGQMQTTVEVVCVNREESSRTVLEEKVLTQPVNEVITVGTGVAETAGTGELIIGDGKIITADGQVLTYSHTAQFLATAYTHTDAGCDFITATGTTVRIGTVAVDPTVIPYGTRMFIVANDGSYVYGISTAEDCGGAIKNKRLDLYFPTTAECYQFGARNCTVYFLD